MASFVKHFRSFVPRKLEIPASIYQEAMAEGVIVEWEGEEAKKLDVEHDSDKHFIVWDGFASAKKMIPGQVVCLTLAADASSGSNRFKVEAFDCGRGRGGKRIGAAFSAGRGKLSGRGRRRRPWEGSDEEDEDTYSGASPIRRRSYGGGGRALLPASPRALGACFMSDCRPELNAPGSESAIQRASNFQREQLREKSSIFMVLPPLATIRSCGLSFKRTFADDYCSWNRGDIEVKSAAGGKVWSVEWDGHRLGPQFADFAAAQQLSGGDVCLFVVRMGGFVVHSFKAVDEAVAQPVANTAAIAAAASLMADQHSSHGGAGDDDDVKQVLPQLAVAPVAAAMPPALPAAAAAAHVSSPQAAPAVAPAPPAASPVALPTAVVAAALPATPAAAAPAVACATPSSSVTTSQVEARIEFYRDSSGGMRPQLVIPLDPSQLSGALTSLKSLLQTVIARL